MRVTTASATRAPLAMGATGASGSSAPVTTQPQPRSTPPLGVSSAPPLPPSGEGATVASVIAASTDAPPSTAPSGAPPASGGGGLASAPASAGPSKSSWKSDQVDP